MFSIARLLDSAKANAQIESDYRLAKVIGITHASLSAYRVGKSLPGDKVVEQLCALSGDDAQLVFAQIQASKASSSEAQKFWNVMVQRLAGGASTAILSALFTISLIAGYAGDARASGLNHAKTQWANSLYIVSSAKTAGRVFVESQARRWPAFFALIACCFLFQSLLSKR